MPVNTSSSSSTPILSRLQSLNPFGDRGGYVSLPTNSTDGLGAPLPAPSRREEEESFFARGSPLFIASSYPCDYDSHTDHSFGDGAYSSCVPVTITLSMLLLDPERASHQELPWIFSIPLRTRSPKC